jgi:acetoacetyl-CoA reductase/3-oxoacyl-[acyl-carrier protein] reductase
MSEPIDLTRLDDRVALVTGGGGAIGGAIATRLTAAGARVYCCDLPDHPGPAGTVTIAGDVTQPHDVAAAVAEIDRDAGRLDVIVHAAGIVRDARLWKLAPDDWHAVIATNLDSAFYVLQCGVPLLRRGGGGSVVFISSINGTRGKVGQAAYVASKAGLDALARTSAREVGAFGIRVNAVAPGWIDTPMTAAVPAAIRQKAIDESALGRLGTPDDVARVVLFLAGDLGRHVTGQVLRVDGGQLIG